MRTLVVTHYFPPEVGAPQARLSELARFWADDGDDVTVLTCMPNHPTGVIPPPYEGKFRADERASGYRILRTWVYATPNERMVKKTLGHLSFMVSSLLLGGPKTGPVDVVVVSSPTFFSIFSAWALARIRRAVLVVEVRDLWPAVFVELGVLKNRSIIRILEGLELAAYRAARAVVVVTEGFRSDLIRRGVPPAKVHTIRNGADLERFPRDVPAGQYRSALGAGPDDVLVLYIGAHGISHALATVVEAAAKLTDARIHVALVGEGAEKERVRERVRDLGVSNVTLHSAVPRDEVPSVLASADICLVPLRDVPLFESFIPSKLFEFLAAGKAVIGSVRGESAQILTEAGALVIEPESPPKLADAITELASDPERRRSMGERGRAYVARHADRRQLATRYREVLLAATERR